MPSIGTLLRSIFLVRSSLAIQESPRFSDLNSRLPPSQTMLGLCGESMNGVFQLNRYCSGAVALRTLGGPPRPPANCAGGAASAPACAAAAGAAPPGCAGAGG